MQNVFWLSRIWVLSYEMNFVIPKSPHHLSIFLKFNYKCQVFWGEGNSLTDTHIKENIYRCFDNGSVKIIGSKAGDVVTLWSVLWWLGYVPCRNDHMNPKDKRNIMWENWRTSDWHVSASEREWTAFDWFQLLNVINTLDACVEIHHQINPRKS